MWSGSLRLELGEQVKMASLPVRPSHESSGFVQPSTYLRRPRGHSQPMPHAEPLNAVDRDQKLGLVSSVRGGFLLRHASRSDAISPLTCLVSWLTYSCSLCAGQNSGFFEGQDEL